jgi:hypothetical protein
MKTGMITSSVFKRLIDRLEAMDYQKLIDLATEFEYVFEVDEYGDIIVPEASELREFLVWAMLDHLASRQPGIIEIQWEH